MAAFFESKVSWVEVDRALRDLGWKRPELARRLGFTETTVRTWRKVGEAPQFVIAYLDVVCLLKDIRGRVHEEVRVRG